MKFQPSGSGEFAESYFLFFSHFIQIQIQMSLKLMGEMRVTRKSIYLINYYDFILGRVNFIKLTMSM